MTCDICRGTGQIQRTVRSLLGNVMTSSPCGTCRGYGTVIPNPCPTCAGQGRVRAKRTIPVDIPAGVDTGLRLQLPGQGEVGPAGGPNGDLYLEIKVRHHDIFSRNGDDLLATLEVQMTDAILGTDRRSRVSTARCRSRSSRAPRAPRSSRSRTAASPACAARVAATSRSASRCVTPTRLNSKEQELIKQFAKSRKPPPPEFAHVPAGPVREAARPLPGLLDRAMAHLYLD